MWIDVCEPKQPALQKYSALETPRSPFSPAGKNNGAARLSWTGEASSRYRSPSPSVSSGPRRCPSPSSTRTGSTLAVSVPKRAISAERKRPSTPSPPPSPSASTPLQDTSAEMALASRKIIGNRLPEGLWPSTMRSLCVAFQSDSFSLPVSKKEKPATPALSDRTLRSSSNIERKQCDTPKPTPGRKRSPLKGRNSVDQSENSRPLDGSNARLVSQQRWPSRAGGKSSSTVLKKYIDLTDKTSKSSTSHSTTGMPSVRRLSPEGASKPLQKSASDSLRLISSTGVLRRRSETRPLDDNKVERPSAVRSQYLPASGSRSPSPNKASLLSSSVARGVSPSRTKATSIVPSRGPSPSRVRLSSPSRHSNSTTSVLSFIVDIKKGKKAANHIEDVHQLRLLYNRHLQWQYVNAQATASLHSQKVKAEKILYSSWRTSSDMLDSVIAKRIELQQLRLKLKLHSILNEQLAYLDQWALIERDHTSSLSLASQDLRACTLRLPITGGASGDIESVKSSVCSAVGVIQAMESSICSLASRAKGMNFLVSELADVGAQQRAMLVECEALLASTAFKQVEEYSLRTHLTQLRQSLQKL